jgi:O-methyltransferase domain/Dimerisation domain
MSARSPEDRLWELLRGALGTRALALAADLGVADALADGPRSVADLAEELNADGDTLRRLLRLLAGEGVFAEAERDVFRNTEASELLRSGWGSFAHLFGGIWFRATGALDASGRPSFPEAFGAEFWLWLAENPHERGAFDRAMEQGNESRVERLAALAWRGDETVVDVGGGNGSLLAGLLEQHPGLRGIVFDLPETTRDEAALGERCTFVEGNFFEHVPEGDVYVLSTILHNWDDAAAARILGTIRAHAPADTRLVVLDAVLPDASEPHSARWLDLLMLALLGGRERDEAEWRTLLAAAGFEPVSVEDGLIEARCR